MNRDFLDFEQPIAELEAKIDELRFVDNDEINLGDEVARLEKKLEKMIKNVFSNLDAVQVSKLARHPKRAYSYDIIERIFTDFQELHGDRHFADDKAIVGGLARFNGQSVMVIGHQKGRDTKENIRRNFGMPRPEGYRKALRMMKMAEKFSIPVVTFIDTPGAYPGVGAEERNQSEAIARNLFEMAQLKTPIISIVTGEGGSGGALAIAVGDHVMMLEYSVYSVISPEGCATILWKSADKAGIAADAMGITSGRLHDLGLINRVIREPLGGGHRDYDELCVNIKQAIASSLDELKKLDTQTLLENRYQRYMSLGHFEEA